MVEVASLPDMPALLDWRRIEQVLLDMDGVLLDLHFDNQFWNEHVPQAVAAQQGRSLQQTRDLLAPRFTERRGQLEWYCVEFWSQELGLDIMSMKQARREHIRVLPGVEVCLQALKASGRQLWLVTNAHPEVMRLKLVHTGIGGYFEHCISTHALGYPKEDPRFWRQLAASYPLTASRALMVDDGAAILRVARDCGIGQVLQLLWPDSSRPANAREELVALERLADLPLMQL